MIVHGSKVWININYVGWCCIHSLLLPPHSTCAVKLTSIHELHTYYLPLPSLEGCGHNKQCLKYSAAPAPPLPRGMWVVQYCSLKELGGREIPGGTQEMGGPTGALQLWFIFPTPSSQLPPTDISNPTPAIETQRRIVNPEKMKWHQRECSITTMTWWIPVHLRALPFPKGCGLLKP